MRSGTELFHLDTYKEVSMAVPDRKLTDRGTTPISKGREPWMLPSTTTLSRDHWNCLA